MIEAKVRIKPRFLHLDLLEEALEGALEVNTKDCRFYHKYRDLSGNVLLVGANGIVEYWREGDEFVFYLVVDSAYTFAHVIDLLHLNLGTPDLFKVEILPGSEYKWEREMINKCKKKEDREITNEEFNNSVPQKDNES